MALRPLHPEFLRDASGNAVLDDAGNQQRNPKAGQPLADDEKSAQELKFDDHQRSQEDDWAISRFRHQAERDEVLAAARRMNATEGGDDTK